MRFCEPEWHDRLASTNTVLMDRLRGGEDLPHGFVLAAREQTAGRGRYKRPWVSGVGQNLTFSFLWITPADFPRLSSLPMAVAVGLSEALEIFGVQAQTKWPNDLLISGAKLSGMLAERYEAAGSDVHRIVMGIGVNVNMEGREAVLIDRAATSMRIETGKIYDVEAVLRRVLQVLPDWLMRWESGGFPAIREGWIDRCSLVGERVTVGEGEDRREGVLEGFGEEGQLLLKCDSGEIRAVWAGDVAGI